MAKRPGINVNILDIDKGFKNILKEARKWNTPRKPHVKVGIQGKSALDHKKAKDANGIEYTPLGAPTVVDIATMHEYGGENGRPPERSFLRATMNQNQQKYVAAAQALLGEVLAGKLTTEVALKRLGLLIETDVKNRILAGIAPELAPSTILRKNRRQIAKAAATIFSMERKVEERTYKNRLKGSKETGKLTASELKKENAAAELIMSGGKSTALIDTGQMFNSIISVVDMGKGQPEEG